MIIRPIRESDFSALEKLFCDYYTELDCEDDPLHLFSEYLLPDLKAGLFEVGVAEACGTDAVCGTSVVCGFIIFQVDDILNDWNFKEGSGDVRELYVAPAMRRRGIGSALLSFAEKRLSELGAGEIYTLPVEESEKFFTERGYSDLGEYCPDADNKVFGKNLS